MLLIVDVGTQPREGTFLVLRLVTCLGTFNQDLIDNARVGILPHIAQTHSRLHLVDVLSTSSRTAEGVPFDLAFVDVHLELIGFGQHSHRSSRGMHTSLCLGDGHTLYAMYTRFVLQCAIDRIAGHHTDDFLETAHRAFGARLHRERPALRFTEALVHLEEVAGKQCRLIATRATTDFEHSILCILRILGDEEHLDLLFNFRNAGLTVLQLLTSHLLHLGIALGLHKFACLITS